VNYIYYQTKINDVIIKCPIETGIEILVYNVFDEIININGYSLVDIDRIWKNQDSRLTTGAGIPDIAILSPDFVFKKADAGNVYGFIEVKAAGVSLRNTKQIIEAKKCIPHFFYTNGIVWKYYFNEELKWEKNLSKSKLLYCVTKVEIDEKEFNELKESIRDINWKNI